MITDEAKLIVNTLRACAGETQCSRCVVFCGNDECLFTVAAEMLESLAAELVQVKQERDGLNILLAQAQSMLETRTRERDAVVEDLRGRCFACIHAKPYDKHPNLNKCPFVSFAVGGQGKRECEHWQWRGVKEGYVE